MGPAIFPRGTPVAVPSVSTTSSSGRETMAPASRFTNPSMRRVKTQSSASARVCTSRKASRRRRVPGAATATVWWAWPVAGSNPKSASPCDTVHR